MAALLEAAGGRDWLSSKIKLKYTFGNSKHSNAQILKAILHPCFLLTLSKQDLHIR